MNRAPVLSAPAIRPRIRDTALRHLAGGALLALSLSLPFSCLAAPTVRDGAKATLAGTSTPLPTSAEAIRKARATRLALQRLLAQKALLLQQKEEETRRAEAQAHLSARQFARLRQRQARLALQHAIIESRLTRVSAQLDQLTDGDSLLQQRKKAILLDEATRLPALRQLDSTPELALLMPPQDRSLSPALPFTLLALRHQQNREAMVQTDQQQDRLHQQQDRLADQSRSIAAQESQLQDSQSQAENRTQQAEKDSQAAQQALLRQQALLTQARQSTEALTAIITTLARQEAESRRRLKAEKARLHRLHRRRQEKELEQKALTLNPGHGLARGKGHAPVQGRPVIRWGQPTEAGPATGLTYQTAPSAPVTAPCTGQVLFSGAFRSFGPMVILDCGQKQRLVLAGMGSLRLQGGQPVQQGGLIGQMPGHDPLLFVQLRHGTRLVDPAQFF